MLDQLAIHHAMQAYVDRDVIPVQHVESQMQQLRYAGRKFKAEPVFGRGLLPGVSQWYIGSLVARGMNGAVQSYRRRVSPDIIGFAFILLRGIEPPQ